MHIFFDVDYTILGGSDHSLRPRTRELFTELRDDGHLVHVWSGEGERWSVIHDHDLAGLVSGVYGKPLQNYRRRLADFNVPVVPDFVIDDDPGIVRCFGGICIPEYFGTSFPGASGRPLDTAFDDVYPAIKVLADGGTPDHPRYFAAGS